MARRSPGCTGKGRGADEDLAALGRCRLRLLDDGQDVGGQPATGTDDSTVHDSPRALVRVGLAGASADVPQQQVLSAECTVQLHQPPALTQTAKVQGGESELVQQAGHGCLRVVVVARVEGH
jgi:hypothetical protein